MASDETTLQLTVWLQNVGIPAPQAKTLAESLQRSRTLEREFWSLKASELKTRLDKLIWWQRVTCALLSVLILGGLAIAVLVYFCLTAS